MSWVDEFIKECQNHPDLKNVTGSTPYAEGIYQVLTYILKTLRRRSQ